MRVNQQKKFEKIKVALENAGYFLFRDESSYVLPQAVRNLSGRTHYVDPDTLKYFGARINGAHIVDQGLLFALLESVAHPSKGRVYRFVVFDVFGTVVSPRVDDDCFHRTCDQAKKAMWTWLNEFDAVVHTQKEMGALAARLAKQSKYLKDGAK